MNREPISGELEARIARSLTAAAPLPDAGLTGRLLARTAAAPQRRGWSLLRVVPPAAVAAAVVALAVVAGLGLGQVLGPIGGPDIGASVSPSPTPSASPSAAPPTLSPTQTPVSPNPFPGGSASCTNDQLGFTVAYPADWTTNEEIDLDEFGEGPPTATCTYFGEGPMDLRPNAGLPPSVAISVSREADPPPPAGELIGEATLTVDGRPAVAREYAPTGDPFIGEGGRVYEVIVELADGDVLILGTDTSRSGDFDAHREVIDAMVATLELN